MPSGKMGRFKVCPGEILIAVSAVAITGCAMAVESDYLPLAGSHLHHFALKMGTLNSWN
jgi:hypothetical protein